MRVAKQIVGWLCFLAIAYIPVTLVVWALITTLPFLHGAKAYRTTYPGGLEWNLRQSIARSGVPKDIDARLKTLVTTDLDSGYGMSGMNAALEVMAAKINATGTSSMETFASGRHALAAAALVDGSGAVLGAYPIRLKTTPIGSVSSGSPDAVRRYAPTAGMGNVSVLENSGRPMYYKLVTYENGNGIAVTPAPDGYATPAWLNGVAEELAGEGVRDLPWRLLGAFILYLLLLPLWVGFDAAWRGTRPWAWGILTALTNVVGLCAYLIARPRAPGRCGNCGEWVMGGFNRCPTCGVSLTSRCPVCGRSMKSGWLFCPSCRPLASTRPVQTPIEQQAPVGERASGSPAIEIGVTDADSGEPLAGASVAVRGPALRDGATDPRGIFVAQRLETGGYTVTAGRPGYTSASVELEIGEGRHPVSLRISPIPGEIDGRVTDADTGQPIVGASVCLDTTRIDRSADTDGEGRFHLSDIPPGPYALQIEAPGYTPVTRLLEMGPGGRAKVDVGMAPSAGSKS